MTACANTGFYFIRFQSKCRAAFKKPSLKFADDRHVLSHRILRGVNASRPNTALCRVWSAAGGIRQSEKLQTKIKECEGQHDEKSNILAAGHRNDDHSACRMRQQIWKILPEMRIASSPPTSPLQSRTRLTNTRGTLKTMSVKLCFDWVHLYGRRPHGPLRSRLY